MDDQVIIAVIRRKTRQRFLFSGVVMVLYFSFVLNWGSTGKVLGSALGESAVSGSLLMFAVLIVTFLLLELVFLYLNRNVETDAEGK